jgi:hypothetical protein
VAGTVDAHLFALRRPACEPMMSQPGEISHSQAARPAHDTAMVNQEDANPEGVV